MGYDTYFSGEFDLSRELTEAEFKYLRAFSQTRRMLRDPELAAKRPDPLREAVGLPIGPAGAYHVGGSGFMGQDEDDSVLRPQYGSPLPGAWCNWTPGDDRKTVIWDEGEKFYYYVAWLEFLIEHFFAPWGIMLNGIVRWDGDEAGDIGKIRVQDNVVTVHKAIITFEGLGPEENEE